MAEQLEEGKSEAELRINQLSDKVKTTSDERDAAKLATETAVLAQQAAEKERDFFQDFSTMGSKFPAAPEYRDKIKEKVMSGYSVEDATVAVLNAEGKLAPAPVAMPQAGPAAGGSATYMPTSDGTKSVQDMSRQEKRNALIEAEKRGDISIT